MSKWWLIALVLLLSTAVGCNIVTSAITSRSIGAAEGDELEFSGPPSPRALPTRGSHTGSPSDASRPYRGILTPIVIQGPLTQTGPSAVAPTVPKPAVKVDPVEPAGPTPQFPDVTLTIKSTPTPAPTLVPTPSVDESIGEEPPQEQPTVASGKETSTPEPRRDCIRPGGMTLWLEPPGGEWVVPLGQFIEINLCLSNVSVDLAGFDVLLKSELTGTFEFTEISMGGFGLESHSELPTESLRIRAIDLKKRLTAGTDGVVLAKIQVVGVAVRESAITIELNGIDNTDGDSVDALLMDSSLRVIGR